MGSVGKGISTCTECNKHFSNRSNLRKHVRKFHGDKVQSVAPLYYKNKSNFAFSCTKCNKHFNQRSNFRYHMRKTHHDCPESAEFVKNEGKRHLKKCPLCSFSSFQSAELLIHFNQEHHIIINRKTADYSSIEEFNQWLNDTESMTFAKYIKVCTKTMKNHTFINYICHRSGLYIPSGKRMRNLKIKGSVKINAFCPASIKLKKYTDGKCQTEFISNHVGHLNKPELGYLYLTKDEKQHLASKIASKVPFDDILNEVRDSITNQELKRIHLLNRQDLYNIEKSFNLTSAKHSNDAISIEAWVNEMVKENCVAFYKPQGILCEKFPELKSEDFVLIIMTSVQSEFLAKYGQDCICCDRTQSMNSYNYELHTLLVLDDLRESYPCAFFISNRADKEILKLFFNYVGEKAGKITPKIFMSDLTDTYYKAWVEVMSTPENRLFCIWHLDYAWRKNLMTIKTKEKQVTIYKHLRTLLQETDVGAFLPMLKEFCEIIQQDCETVQFGKYFIDNYSQNYQLWAYSFRVQLGINSNNIQLERMHRTIKYIYLKGKKVERLDKAMNAIMHFTREKLINRLIAINKGKFTTKRKDIRSRHKNSLTLDLNSITTTDVGWEIPSQNGNEKYVIQEVNPTCTCQLICTECGVCIHKYYCSCIDSSIKFNICKHIHALAALNKLNIPNNQQQLYSDDEIPFEEDVMHVDTPKPLDETEISIKQIDNHNTIQEIDEEKEKIKTWFLHHLDKINTREEMDAVKKMLAPLSQSLPAIRQINQDFVPTATKTDRKITTQRQLWSTNKKSKISEQLNEKPSVESNNIAVLVLLHNK